MNLLPDWILLHDREFWHILMSLKKNLKTTLILTTHYMEEAAFLCDEIVIMDHGKFLAKGTLEQLLCEHDKGEIIEFSLQERPQTLNLALKPSPRDFAWDSESRKGWVLVNDIVSSIPGFMQFIDTNKFHLTSFECRKMTLEDIFLSLTGRKINDEE